VYYMEKMSWLRSEDVSRHIISLLRNSDYKGVYSHFTHNFNNRTDLDCFSSEILCDLV